MGIELPEFDVNGCKGSLMIGIRARPDAAVQRHIQKELDLCVKAQGVVL